MGLSRLMLRDGREGRESRLCATQRVLITGLKLDYLAKTPSQLSNSEKLLQMKLSSNTGSQCSVLLSAEDFSTGIRFGK
jgi:hypothetical protein